MEAIGLASTAVRHKLHRLRNGCICEMKYDYVVVAVISIPIGILALY